jgi:hypothetical protein
LHLHLDVLSLPVQSERRRSVARWKGQVTRRACSALALRCARTHR